MPMEMNKIWEAHDFKELGIRISYAANAYGETPTQEEREQIDFVAHACKVFLSRYEKLN